MSAADAHHDDEDQGTRMARAVALGAAVALPIAYLVVVLMVWLIGDGSLGQALITAVLPGILIGGFFGGFWGMTKTSI